MKITVRVKPNSKVNDVEEITSGEYQVRITAPPVDGKANSKLIEVLSGHFRKPKSKISIISGKTSKIKLIEIL